MKKIIALISLAVIMSSCLMGCGQKKNETNDMQSTTASTNTQASTNVLDDIMSGGDVTDGDGIIGNENNTTQESTQSTTNANSTSSTGSGDQRSFSGMMDQLM